MGKLNSYDPLYDDIYINLSENKELKKLKKDRRKQKFKKKKRKTPKTFKRRDSRKAIIKRGKHK